MAFVSTDGRKFSTTYLLAILKLSVRFNIPEGRVFALRHLDTIQLDEPHEKFLCAVEYKLQQWFIPGFMKIARHPLHWIIEHYYPRLGIVCIQAFAQMHDNIAAFRRDLATWMVPDDMMFPPGPYAFLAEYHSCRKHWRTVIAKVAIKVLSQDGCLFRDDMKELIEGVRETHARTTPEKICEPCFQSGLLDLIRRGRLSNEEELAMQQARTLQSSLFGREALLPLLSDGETPSYSNYDW